MNKYLYCVMDCTSSECKPGWDVEVYKDTEEIRKAWKESTCGTDDSIIQDGMSDLTKIAFETEQEAEEYVKYLKTQYTMTDITELEQDNY